MGLYSYAFDNKKRDLSDTLSDIVKDEPRFISLFLPGQNQATQLKHEWLEDQIGGRAVTATNVSGLVCTMSEGDVAKLKVGSLLTVKNDTALFRVASITGTSVTVALAATNGSTKTTPATNDVLNIVSTPMKEGTNNGDGEESYRQTGKDYNCTQIFRKDIVLTGTALAIKVYGNVDNQLNRQTAYALSELARDLNRVVLFGGRRVEGSASANGEAAGLYFFGTQTGGMQVNAGNNTLDSYIINDGAQAVLGEGGEATTILCSPGQARVISNEYKGQLQILRADERRGAYVAVIVNEITGRGLTIMAEPDMPDTEAWVMDTSGFAMVAMNGRGITDEDSTPKGFDGIRRTALGELTFEFKNAKQRLCRIKGLKDSASALAEYKAGKTQKTTVTNAVAVSAPVAVTRGIVVNADADVPAASAENFGFTVRIGTAWTGGTKIATAVVDEVYASNGTDWIKQ